MVDKTARISSVAVVLPQLPVTPTKVTPLSEGRLILARQSSTRKRTSVVNFFFSFLATDLTKPKAILN
jgi:hypothetical protein